MVEELDKMWDRKTSLIKIIAKCIEELGVGPTTEEIWAGLQDYRDTKNENPMGYVNHHMGLGVPHGRFMIEIIEMCAGIGNPGPAYPVIRSWENGTVIYMVNSSVRACARFMKIPEDYEGVVDYIVKYIGDQRKGGKFLQLRIELVTY